MDNSNKFLSTVFVIALIIVAGFLLFTQGPRIQINNQPKTNNQTSQSNFNIEIGDLPPLGNPEASVKIVEFADFLCPYCAQTTVVLYPQLEPLIAQGKVVVYFRDFVVHPQATPIHNAARCANEQSKYWEFNKEIFKKFMNGEDTTKKEVWQNLAQALNLDLGKFNQCIDEGRYLQAVQNDTQYGINVGVSGTPTFFINNQKVVGIDIPKIQSTLNQLIK